jgi:replicative DNA helicase
MNSTMFYRKGVDYDLEMEAAVLGICILDPIAYGSVLQILCEECFYSNDHLYIYQQIDKMHKEGYPIDILTLTHNIRKSGKEYMESNDNVGYFIANLTFGVYNSAHLETWCLILREKAANREMINLKTSGYVGDDVFESAGLIKERLNKILDVRYVDDWKTITQVAKEAETEIKERALDPNNLLTTTFATVDSVNGGFRAGNLIILAARPSVGKSALLGRLATRNASLGKKVGIISLEMENTSIYTRLVSFESDVNFSQIDRDTLEGRQRKVVYETIHKMDKYPIYFSDTASVNSQDIRSKVEKLKKKYGCDILFIDYLQLIETPNERGKSREQEVAKISKEMKALARTMQIPIVLLAQVNRAAMDKGDSKPQLHHLRESGSIEADADIVMFLHRDWLVGKTTDAEGRSTEKEAHLLIRKWRNGAPFEMKIGFEPSIMKFYELEGETIHLVSPEPEQQNPSAGIGNRGGFLSEDDFRNF